MKSSRREEKRAWPRRGISSGLPSTLESARARMGLDERRKEQDEWRDLKGNG